MILLTDSEWQAVRERQKDMPWLYEPLFKNADNRIQTSYDFNNSNLVTNLYELFSIFQELSLSFALSGQRKYLDYLLSLLAQLSNQQWQKPNFPWDIHFGYLLAGVASACDLLKDKLTPDEYNSFARLAQEIASHLMEMRKTAPFGQDRFPRYAWNHTAVPHGALAFAELVFGADLGENHAEIAKIGEKFVNKYLELGITQFGNNYEGLFYFGFVLRILGLYLRACQNTGKANYFAPNSVMALKLARIADVYDAHLFPGGRYFHNFNDSHMNPASPMAGFLTVAGMASPAKAAQVLHASLGKGGIGSWGADATYRGSSLFETICFWPGESKSRADLKFYDRALGLWLEKTGAADGYAFSFNCGKFIGNIHDQSDNGSITLLSGGVPLLIDGGSACDPTEGSRSSSYSHCAVLINGKGQRPAGKGYGVSGQILELKSDADFTLVRSDLAESYNLNDYNPVKHAFRGVVFAKYNNKFAYLLVYDDIETEEASDFEFIFNTPKASAIKFSQNLAQIKIDFQGRSNQLLATTLYPACAPAVQPGAPIPLSPIAATQRFSFKPVIKTVNPHFVTLLTDQTEKDITAILRRDQANRFIITITGGAYTDTITLNPALNEAGALKAARQGEAKTEGKAMAAPESKKEELELLLENFKKKSLPTLKAKIDYLLQNGLFDEEYYLNRYPDVSRHAYPAIIHYINHGIREKRIPCSLLA